MIEGIIGATVGSIVTAILSYLLAKRKERREDKKEAAKLVRKAFEERPELKIVEYKDYLLRVGYGIKQKCDIEVFLTKIIDVSVGKSVVAKYNLEQFSSNEWCCVIYTLQNVGKTDISVIDVVSTYKKDTVLFSCKSARMLGEDGVLNYTECFDKKIRVGESFTLKLCYHKDCVLGAMFSANIVIGMQDSNGVCWQQPLFAPTEKLYDSYRIGYKEYLANLRTDNAEECFRKPYLW